MYCSVLTSGVAVVDRVVERMALADPESHGVAQRTLDEAGVLDQRTLPADDHTGVGVDDERGVAEPVGHRHVGEVGHLQQVRRRNLPLPAHQVRRPGRGRIRLGSARRAAGAGHPTPAVAAHDPLHRAPRHRDAPALQVRPHLQAAIQALRRAFPVGIGFVVAGQDLGDRGVPQRPFRRRRRAVRPVGARGDRHAVHGQCPADRYDPVRALRR